MNLLRQVLNLLIHGMALLRQVMNLSLTCDTIYCMEYIFIIVMLSAQIIKCQENKYPV